MSETGIKITNGLPKEEADTIVSLQENVCAVCGIKKNLLFENTYTLHIAQARWLFWYAYRYMTGEPFTKMTDMFLKNDGGKFTASGITQGVNKMSVLINDNTIWTKRWLTIKNTLGLHLSPEQECHTITIQIPKELKDKLKIKIKEI